MAVGDMDMGAKLFASGQLGGGGGDGKDSGAKLAGTPLKLAGVPINVDGLFNTGLFKQFDTAGLGMINKGAANFSAPGTKLGKWLAEIIKTGGEIKSQMEGVGGGAPIEALVQNASFADLGGMSPPITPSMGASMDMGMSMA